MTRLKLTWTSIPARTNVEIQHTFRVMIVITLFLLILNWILSTIMLYEIEIHTNEENNLTTLTYSPLYEMTNMLRNWMNILCLIYTVFTMTKTRSYIRTIYSIPGSLWGDCWVSFWCVCCTISQMASQTTEYDLYPGKCCTSTGLPRNAPSTIDDSNIVIDSIVVDGAVPISHATIV